MTLQGIYLKEQTLKYFNEHLSAEQFLKVHRSYIVNINAIETIERYGRDQYVLLLKNKEKIKATVEGYRRLKEKLSL
jgi:DNA-binding LytR/AlgR family response regulator